MPLFWNMCALEAEKLLHSWDRDWSSIYQFNHGQKACRLIAVANTPDDPQDPTLLVHLLWIPSAGSTHTITPMGSTAEVTLTNFCVGDVLGAWTLSKFLLLLVGGNLPIGFGMTVNDLFCAKLSSNSLPTMARALPPTLRDGCKRHGATVGLIVPTRIHKISCSQWCPGVK